MSLNTSPRTSLKTSARRTWAGGLVALMLIAATAGSALADGGGAGAGSGSGQRADVGTGGGGSGGSQPAPIVPLRPERRGTYFGAYLRPGEWTVDGQKHAVTSVESDLGRTIDISNHYYWFEKTLSDWREAWDLEQGRIPLISWDGTYTSDIVGGEVDGRIRRMADDVGALGGEVFLRFFWEMDGYKKADVAESPKKFIAAWRYVHDLFEQRGATNVAWVWCPNAWAFAEGTAMKWYPGDAYVDWACADGYNWGKRGRHRGTWRPFSSIFKAFYKKMAGRKPLMVGETGSVERGGSKAKWIKNAATTIKKDMPRIRAFVWFNSVDGAYDWRIDSTRSTYSAYRRVARDPYFNP